MLWTRGTPAGEQGRGHPGRQIEAGDTPGDGGRGKSPGRREWEAHSPHPGPAPQKVRPSPLRSSGCPGPAGRGRPAGRLLRRDEGRGGGGAWAAGVCGEAKPSAPPGRCAALRRARAPPAAIPAGGDRRRKGRFLRSPRPLPSPSADADVGWGSWRDAQTAARRLLGAGAPRYLPSGVGAGARRAGCRLQRETPGNRGGRGASLGPLTMPSAGGGWQAGRFLRSLVPVWELPQPLPLPRLLSQAWAGLEDARAMRACVSPGEREGSVPGAGRISSLGARGTPTHARPLYPRRASPSQLFRLRDPEVPSGQGLTCWQVHLPRRLVFAFSPHPIAHLWRRWQGADGCLFITTSARRPALGFPQARFSLALDPTGAGVPKRARSLQTLTRFLRALLTPPFLPSGYCSSCFL